MCCQSVLGNGPCLTSFVTSSIGSRHLRYIQLPSTKPAIFSIVFTLLNPWKTRRTSGYDCPYKAFHCTLRKRAVTPLPVDHFPSKNTIHPPAPPSPASPNLDFRAWPRSTSSIIICRPSLLPIFATCRLCALHTLYVLPQSRYKRSCRSCRPLRSWRF